MKAGLAIATLAFALLNAPALAQEAGEPAKGLAVARTLCAGCHAIQSSDWASPNLLAPPFDRIANVPGMTAMALNSFLQSSHETMPNIMVPPDEKWHLIAYILSLKTN